MRIVKTPYGKMQVVDEFVIEDDDKLAFVEKAKAKYKELDKEGWFSLENTEPYWYAFPYNRAKFTLCANKNDKVCFIDWRKADYDFLFENKESLFDYLLEEYFPEARVFSHSSGFGLLKPSWHYDYEEPKKEPLYLATETNEDDGEMYFDEKGNSSKFITHAKRFTSEEDALEFAKNNAIFGEPGAKLLEAVEDFPKNTRAMYRFAKRRHDDTGAIRKVSKEPYWVHPEGVAKIVMEHGGSDVEIKAAMAHDVLEDTGESYEDMVEKFGEKVASIVKEVTNDKDEIAKVGKEKYISEELCRLSPEALTVKLADMLYNMKDSPTEKNYERMRKNIAFLMMNRQLDGKHLELAQEIMEV